MQAAAECQPEPHHVPVCRAIYWVPLGSQFTLRTGAQRLFAVAMDGI